MRLFTRKERVDASQGIAIPTARPGVLPAPSASASELCGGAGSNQKGAASFSRIVGSLRGLLVAHPRLVMSAIVLLYAVISLIASATRPLWSDELYTLNTSDQPTLHLLFSVLRTGAETNPPGFHLLTRAVIRAFGTSQMVLRLPELVASLLLLPMLYCIVKRRLGIAAGYLAALVPLATLAPSYSLEARPYALLLALGALVLLSWQTYIDGRRPRLALAGIALGGAAATCLHYYAPLILLPIAVGELVRSRHQRKVDYRVWSCLLFAVLPLVAFIPFIRAGARLHLVPVDPVHAYQSVSSYRWLLPVPTLAVLCGLAIAVLVAARGRQRRGEVLALPLPGPEMAAVITYLFVPAAAVAMGEVVTGMYMPRYGLPAVIGVALIIPAAASFLEKASGRLTTSLCVIVALTAIGVAVNMQRYGLAQRNLQHEALALIEQTRPGTSVIVAEPLAFLQLNHAAPKRYARSLIYIADPAQATAKTGSNGADVGLIKVAPFMHLNVRTYANLIGHEREFLVLIGSLESEWLVGALRHDGYAMRALRRDGQLVMLSATLLGARQAGARTSL